MPSTHAEGVGPEASVRELGSSSPVPLFSLCVSGHIKASLGPSFLFINENCAYLCVCTFPEEVGGILRRLGCEMGEDWENGFDRVPLALLSLFFHLASGGGAETSAALMQREACRDGERPGWQWLR